MSKIDRRRRNAAYLGLIFGFWFALASTAKAQDPTSSAGNLAKLLAGNERFVSGKLQTKDYLTERPQLAQGQHPYAIVVACADSRVSPEILFDESLGRLFVVRTAGAVVDPVALGSIEYAVEHLHVNLILVIGHEACGAVKATISGGEFPPNIQSLVRRIKPAVDKAFSQGISEQEFLQAAIKENVRYQMQAAMFESEVLSQHVIEKKLAIMGGLYRLKTGKIEMVVTNVAVARTPDKPNVADANEQKPPTDRPAETTVPKEHRTNPPKPAATEAPKEHKTNTQHPAATEAPKAQPSNADHSSATEEVSPDEWPKDSRPPSLVPVRFADRIRLAYEKKLNVMLRKTMLMRDERDRCITDNCLTIAAGEQVSLDNPLILSVMGRPQLKIRYNGRPCYILADPEAMEVLLR